MSLRSVLIIDDDPELLRQMAEAFVAAGYAVQTAPDGQLGLRQFKAAPTDLVVTDIIMPNREGLETIIALKAARPQVAIVAISGGYRVGPADFLDLAARLGADAVLAKPFRLSELVAVAEAALAPLQTADAA